MDLTRYSTRTVDTPWGAFPRLDPDGPSLWFESEIQALQITMAIPEESYTIQFLPKKGYKKK